MWSDCNRNHRRRAETRCELLTGWRLVPCWRLGAGKMRYKPVKAPWRSEGFYTSFGCGNTSAWCGRAGFSSRRRHCGLLCTARARQGLAARVKQCKISVFMYTEYTFNTPEGVMQGYFCYKCHHLCARPLTGGPR